MDLPLHLCLTNGAVARCIAIYAVKRSSANVIAAISAGAKSPTAPALISVPRSWPAKAASATGRLDTIVGARHKGGILSAVERKSKLTRLRKLATKAAAEMKDNTIAAVSAARHQGAHHNGRQW